MRSDEEFAPLRMVKKNLTGFDRCVYRVYKSPSEFVSVEAATALEAFRESGIKNPFRIMRETRFMERLVDESRFSDKEDQVETGRAAEASPAVISHQEPVPEIQGEMAEAVEEETAAETNEEEQNEAATLSSEEIDNLLKEQQ